LTASKTKHEHSYALGYRSAFFSFSLYPGEREGKMAELASDLYLSMRIGKRHVGGNGPGDMIYEKAGIIRGWSRDIGFVL
jgi:hypothetical protein